MHRNWLFLITQTFSLSRIMNLALEFTRSCSASVSLFQWQTGDSLQDSRWKLSKRILLVMQKALLLTLTSVHVLMVVLSHALKHIPLFRLINGPYFFNFLSGIICVGGDGIINEVSHCLLLC